MTKLFGRRKKNWRKKKRGIQSECQALENGRRSRRERKQTFNNVVVLVLVLVALCFSIKVLFRRFVAFLNRMRRQRITTGRTASLTLPHTFERTNERTVFLPTSMSAKKKRRTHGLDQLVWHRFYDILSNQSTNHVQNCKKIFSFRSSITFFSNNRTWNSNVCQ